MIRPYEAQGLTTGLAQSVARTSTDLTALIADRSYRARLDADVSAFALAVTALDRLSEARIALQMLADTLALLALPATCVHCGLAVSEPERHVCPLLPREEQP